MMIDNLQKLRGPAIGLIIAGSLNGMIGLLALLGGLMRLSGIGGRESLPVEDAERIGYMTSTVVTYAMSLLSLLLAPVIIYGAVQMMKAKNYKAVRIAAILVILSGNLVIAPLSAIFVLIWVQVSKTPWREFPRKTNGPITVSIRPSRKRPTIWFQPAIQSAAA